MAKVVQLGRLPPGMRAAPKKAVAARKKTDRYLLDRNLGEVKRHVELVDDLMHKMGEPLRSLTRRLSKPVSQWRAIG
jgi:hypothetical protein